MVINCTGIALQFSPSLHTVRAPFSWTHQSACIKLLAQKSKPEDRDSLFFSSKTCFRALAVAFDLSKDEWLWLFAPCCLLLPRNLRLQETGCSPARILQESSCRCSFVLKVFYKRGWSGQRKEWRANQWRKKTEERMVASPTHDGERAIFTIWGYRSGYRRVSPWVSLWSLESPFPPRAWTFHFHCLCYCKKPRKTKDQGSGRNKERQQKRGEGERDGWQRSRAMASDPQPSTRIPP